MLTLEICRLWLSRGERTEKEGRGQVHDRKGRAGQPFSLYHGMFSIARKFNYKFEIMLVHFPP